MLTYLKNKILWFLTATGFIVYAFAAGTGDVAPVGGVVATSTATSSVQQLSNAQLKTIRDKADVKLAQFWQLLQTKQNAYYAKHGKYFQLLVTSPTVDGGDTSFVLLRPNDEKYPLDVNFTINSPIPFQIEVSEWVGPDGEGYKAQVYLNLSDGRTFTRHRDSNQNDSGWYEYIDTI